MKGGVAISVEIDERVPGLFLVDRTADAWVDRVRKSTIRNEAALPQIPSENLKRGLQHTHAALAFKEETGGFEEFGKRLLLNGQHFHDDSSAVTREAIRLVQGILLNLKYVARNFSDALYIVLIRDGDLVTFFSCFADQAFRFSEELSAVIHGLHSCVADVPLGVRDPEANTAAILSVFPEDVFEEIEPKLPSTQGALWNAIVATIRFANVYRPIAVHEGTEQQLSFIIGLDHELRTYLSREIELEDQELVLPGPSAKLAPIPDAIIDARSELKAFSNVLSQPDYAVFVDLDSRGSDHGTGELEYSVPAVFRFTSDNYKYPDARSFMDINREESMAIVKIHGRTRIDLIYKGEPVASWNDHTASWGVGQYWSEKELVEEVCSLVCARHRTCQIRRAASSCSAAVCERSSALRTLTAAVLRICRTPQEGAAVVVCCDKGFDLETGRYGRTGLRNRLVNMAAGNVYALNCLKDVKQKTDEDLLIHMLTLDGGSVLNMTSGKFWCRRKFIGPESFRLDEQFRLSGEPKIKVALKGLWTDRTDEQKGDLYWADWSRFKEWGTRHQSSLSLSACRLFRSDGTANVRSSPAGYRTSAVRFVVLVASADGSLTLMHNGRAIPPRGSLATRGDQE